MKLSIVSLGCDKNLVDSEKMLGQLIQRGFTYTDSEEDADVILVNTCCFIGDAKEESIETLISLAELKKKGSLKLLFASGCLAQRYANEIREEIPEVDGIIGISDIDGIADAISKALEGNKISVVGNSDRIPVFQEDRLLTTGGHYAYLKIAEGCDKFCSYCIIPMIRGRYRSVPMEDLLGEATRLAQSGVKELILVAQETTIYGTDLYGERKLPELLRRLSEIEDLHWIRIMYCYPEEVTEDLIDTISSLPKVCHYLDIPIQHCSDHVLKEMGRKTTREHLDRQIAMMRKKIPDICLRTTLISGFPGETQEDFEELYRFVNETEFQRLGVFAYSPEEGTAAAKREDQIPDEVKEARRDELMELQQAVAFDMAEEMIGKTLEAFVLGYLPEEDIYAARTYMDAPDVDGLLFFTSSERLMSGDFVQVRITESKDYDLVGEIV